MFSEFPTNRVYSEKCRSAKCLDTKANLCQSLNKLSLRHMMTGLPSISHQTHYFNLRKSLGSDNGCCKTAKSQNHAAKMPQTINLRSEWGHF
jgi:hypothetical protein